MIYSMCEMFAFKVEFRVLVFTGSLKQIVFFSIDFSVYIFFERLFLE
jgi:hypothetical protein